MWVNHYMESTRPTSTRRSINGLIKKLLSPQMIKAGTWLAIGLGVVLLLISAVTLVGYFTCQISGQIMPGVTVAGMPLEGMSLQRAERELDRAWNNELRITAVDTSDANRAWVVAPIEFGLGVDAEATAMRAFAVGRGQGLIKGIATWVRGFYEPVEVIPWVVVDEVIAREGLEAWEADIGIPPVEAQLSLEGGVVQYQAGRSGWVLDVDASLVLLQDDPSTILIKDRLVPLVTVPSDPAILDASAVAEQIDGMLQAEVDLEAYDAVTDEYFTWTPDRELIASWFELRRSSSAIRLNINADSIEMYLETLDSSLGEERTFDHDAAGSVLRNAFEGHSSEPILIRYLPTSYIIVSGDNLVSIGFKVSMPFWKLLDENPLLSRRGLRVGESLVVPPKDSLLELPIVIGKRIIINISQQRMWVYQDGDLYREYVISTGIDSSPTMPGIFQITTHEPNAYASIWDLYMPHFMGIYYATPDLLNGIHGLPLLSSGRRLWADVLGRPASYGCIILNLGAAEELYNWAENGVVVEIQP